MFAAPCCGAVVLSQLVGPNAGLLGLVGGAAISIGWLRRSARGERVVLRVTHDRLHVLAANGKTVKSSFSFDELDVVMDTKTIQKVEESRGAIPGTVNSTIGPELDTARIVVTGNGRHLTLTDDFVSHTDAIEWFAKIRVFLRKQGWVPADERAPDGDGGDPS